MSGTATRVLPRETDDAKGPGCHSGVENGTKTPNRVGAELGVAREGKMFRGPGLVTIR